MVVMKNLKLLGSVIGIFLVLFISGCIQQSGQQSSTKDETYGIDKDLESADNLENIIGPSDLDILSSDLNNLNNI